MISRERERERERRPCKHFGQTGKLALMTCPENFNAKGSSSRYMGRQADLMKSKTSMAFHPRPQIASDLGRTRHPQLQPAPEIASDPRAGTTFLAYGRRLKSQWASTRRDLRIASPTRPYVCGVLNSPNRNPQAIAELGPPKRPQIAKSPATRPLRARRQGHLPDNKQTNSGNLREIRPF